LGIQDQRRAVLGKQLHAVASDSEFPADPSGDDAGFDGAVSFNRLEHLLQVGLEGTAVPLRPGLEPGHEAP
jgi:hypothetical protein